MSAMPYDRLDVLDVASGGIGTVKEIAAGDCVWSAIDPERSFVKNLVNGCATHESGHPLLTT